MSPEDLLRTVSARYAALDSYQDEGVVLTHDPVKPGPDQIHFTTLFRRPRLFRFEWTSHHPYPPLRHIVNKEAVGFDGSGAYYYSSKKGHVEAVESLEIAIGMATGVSDGSALTISCLLSDLIQINKTDLDIKEAVLLGEEEFEGIACRVIHGRRLRWSCGSVAMTFCCVRSRNGATPPSTRKKSGGMSASIALFLWRPF